MINSNSKNKNFIYISNIMIENLQINRESLDKFDSFVNIDSLSSFSTININALVLKMNNISISNKYFSYFYLKTQAFLKLI